MSEAQYTTHPPQRHCPRCGGWIKPPTEGHEGWHTQCQVCVPDPVTPDVQKLAGQEISLIEAHLSQIASLLRERLPKPQPHRDSRTISRHCPECHHNFSITYISHYTPRDMFCPYCGAKRSFIDMDENSCPPCVEKSRKARERHQQWLRENRPEDC